MFIKQFHKTQLKLKTPSTRPNPTLLNIRLPLADADHYASCVRVSSLLNSILLLAIGWELISQDGATRCTTNGTNPDAHHSIIDDCEIIVDYNRQRLMPGWIPRRLGGGLGGKKESGQLRFGGREKPFRAPLRPIPFDDLKRLGIPPPPEGRYMSRFQDPSPPRRKRSSVDWEEGSQTRDGQEHSHNRSSGDSKERYHSRSSIEQEESSKKSSSLDRVEHYGKRTSMERDDRSYNWSSSRREERHHKSTDRTRKRSSEGKDERSSHKRHNHRNPSYQHERRSGSHDRPSDY